MSARAASGQSPNYPSRVFAAVRLAGAQLLRPPMHFRRAEAARRFARQALLLAIIAGPVIIGLMYALDAREIGLMPPRGAASLWLIRILTDLGKSAYVLWTLAAMLLAVAMISPRLRGKPRSRLLRLGTRLQFVFVAVMVPVLAGELIKWIVGRGRPFVGGEANPFNFEHFAGTEAYASFPSGHSSTSFALAFAVGALWPRARAPMFIYASLIALSRLVLLAHHPSDVVAGALIGVVGALFVRYWFAARRLGFTIGRDGEIVPVRRGFTGLKRVARDASAP